MVEAVSVTGTPASVGGTLIALPVHAIGDVIVLFVWNGAAVVPTPPAASGTVPAWTLIPGMSLTGTSLGIGVWYFTATATNHTSGTWTNTSGFSAIVLRGASGTTPYGGKAIQATTATNTSTAPAVTQADTSGASMLLQFYANRSATAWGAAPANYTRQAAFASTGGSCLNSKTSSTTDGAIAQTLTSAATGEIAAQVEFVVPSRSLPFPSRRAFQALLAR
jgi:hypothetical protein